MAQAYVPIQTQTLTGNTATVTFDNIPQSYTDLKVVVSPRVTGSASPSLWMDINGTTSGYSMRFLSGSGASAGSGTRSYAHIDCGVVNYSTTTSSTFSSHEIYIPNYTSSNNKSISIDVVQETNSTTAYMYLLAGLWSNSAAITKLVFTAEDGSSFVQHSTFTLYGIGGTRASGGTITADARYTYHTFTASGTFTALEKIKGAEILAIAGGGGAHGAGGGAGGVVYASGQTLSAGSSYTTVVGAGGVGTVATSPAPNGNNSSFSSFVALGGGGGAQYGGNGANGGSGGGGAQSGSGGTATQSSGTNFIGYGNNGATGANVTGGGGGGAGGAGTAGSGTTGGNGGIGTSLFSAWGYATNTGQLSGGVYYYAGGGGGGAATTGGTGGLGGGTNGAPSGAPTPATANTGGGCGGGYSSIGSNLAGGSGLVIIRYPN